eukprot:1157445-Pelagomonas_calceolata.AAC.1
MMGYQPVTQNISRFDLQTVNHGKSAINRGPATLCFARNKPKSSDNELLSPEVDSWKYHLCVSTLPGLHPVQSVPPTAITVLTSVEINLSTLNPPSKACRQTQSSSSNLLHYEWGLAHSHIFKKKLQNCEPVHLSRFSCGSQDQASTISGAFFQHTPKRAQQ